MLQLKFVPAANWAATPFQGPQIVLIDEQNRQGLWNGSAYELPGSGGSGGGSSSGGGSDRTGVVAESDGAGGSRVAQETLNGIPVTYGYDIYGRLATRSWVAGGLLATINYADASTAIASSVSGNRFVRGDAWLVTVSQMAALKAALITLALTDETPTFYVEDFDSGRGLWLEWDAVNQGFRGVGGAPIKVAYRYEDDAAGTWSGSASESGDRWTATVPGWLRHLNSSLVVQGQFSVNGDGSNSVTKTLRVYHGGVNSYNSAIASSNANGSQRFAGRWTNRNSLSAQIIDNSGAWDGIGSSSSDGGTGTVATGSDTTVAIRYIMSNSGFSAGILFNAVEVLLFN